MPVTVNEGTSIMEAAAALGISIPSMCFSPGMSNHPSCMVCLVKDLDRENLVPACAMPVSAGMKILTDTEEVREARKEALELLLSDHLGDCEAPCRLSCPAGMDIPLMNRLIAAGDFEKALQIVRRDIALPLVLGFICPAPCEKACKRRPIDQEVSICLLKRAAAVYGTREHEGFTNTAADTGKKIAVIGTGPAGLSAAFYLLRAGNICVLFDQHEKAGGAMRCDIPDDVLPKEILDSEIMMITEMGGEFRLGVAVTRDIFENSIRPGFDAVILATGNFTSVVQEIFGLSPDEHGACIDKNNFTTSIPGVFGCGNIIREQKMAIRSAAQGRMAAMQAGIFLQQELQEEKPPAFNSVTGHLFKPEWKEYLKESIADPRVEPRGGFIAGFTREEAIFEAQRCMHCDCRKPDSCKLRIYAAEYGANRKRFAGEDRKMVSKSVQHDLVVYETGKCIRCGLCVEITEKRGESIGLTFAGRGFDVCITVPFGGTIREALTNTAMECVDACPTGALALKEKEERSA